MKVILTLIKTYLKNNEQSIFFILSVVAMLVACNNRKTSYETKDWFSSNLSLSYIRQYPNENLVLKVNGSTIYSKKGDSSLYPASLMFNFPQDIKTVELVSYRNSKKVLNSIYHNHYHFKRISVNIGFPHPKGTPYPAWPVKKGWFFLPIDSIDRYVIIEPDTSKDLVILQEDTIPKK